MEQLQWFALIAGILLQVLLISALVRGPFRQYPFLFVYAIAELLSAVVNATAFFDLGKWTKANQRFYWIGEGVQYVLIFVILLHLLSKVFDGERRARLVHFIAAGFLYCLVSLWLGYDKNENLWMTETLRNINFGSIFLNLILWTMMLRKGNRQILMVTAAFGMQFAGVAIGHSLRQISRELVLTGNLVLMLSYFLCLFTLWRAMLIPQPAPAVAQPPLPILPSDTAFGPPDESHKSVPV